MDYLQTIFALDETRLETNLPGAKRGKDSAIGRIQLYEFLAFSWGDM